MQNYDIFVGKMRQTTTFLWVTTTFLWVKWVFYDKKSAAVFFYLSYFFITLHHNQ